MSTCKGCGASIIWIETVGGKKMPCNPEQIKYWKNSTGKAKIVTPNGEVVSADINGDLDKATGIGYISHYATCPNAGRFRGRR